MMDSSQTCLSCSIVQGLTSTHGGTIPETAFFHAHQDFAYPIPGMVILAARRHFRHLHELTPEELTQFTELMYKSRHNLSEKGIGLFTKTWFQTFSIQDLAKESFKESFLAQVLKAV